MCLRSAAKLALNASRLACEASNSIRAEVNSSSGRCSAVEGWHSGLQHFRNSGSSSFHQSHASQFTRGLHASARKEAPRTASELGFFAGAAAVGMIGFTYASVPLYRVFCAATGYGGTVKVGKSVEEKLLQRITAPDPKVESAAAEREITVWFNSDVHDSMPWTFTPTQECVRVKPGQSTLAFFTATNLSDKPVTGYSVYNVTPDKAAFYFNKIQCFCFEEQRLRAKEVIDMPVFFYIDPEMATDWNCRNVNDITLSYTFHKVDEEDSDMEEDADDAGPSKLRLHGSLPPGTYPPGFTLPNSGGIEITPAQMLAIQAQSARQQGSFLTVAIAPPQ